MKRFLLSAALIGGTLAAAAPAMAEPAEGTDAANPKMRTITSIVGYEQKTIGTIQFGEGIENPTADQAFQILDRNYDGKMTKAEMFQDNRGGYAKVGKTNIKTSSGQAAKVDFDVRQNPERVVINDMTGNGTFFESLDSNKDGFVTREEFQQVGKVIPTTSDIEPAAGDMPPAPAPRTPAESGKTYN